MQPGAPERGPGADRTRRTALREVFRDRNLRLLLGVSGIWTAADWALQIAVAVLAFDVGGAAGVGLISAIRVLPAAVFGGVLAMVCDRFPRPRVLAAVLALFATLTLVLAWLSSSGAPMVALLVVIAVASAASSVVKPSIQSLLPQLASSPAQLIVATSANSAVKAASGVVGPLFSGALLAALGPVVTFLALAVIFGVGAAAALWVRSPFRPARRATRSSRPALGETLRGVQVLLGRGPRTLTWLFLLHALTRGFLSVAIVVLAVSVLGSQGQTGALFAAIGVGGLLGSIALFGIRVRRDATWAWFGLVLASAALLPIGLWPMAVVVWCALAVHGLGILVTDVFGYTVLARLVPDHVAGRVWGAFYSVTAGAIAVGSLVASAVISGLGLSAALIAAATVLLVGGAASIVSIRAIDADLSTRPWAADLFEQVELFAFLPPIMIERLARGSKELAVPAGTVVVTEGEPGDEFYVVVDGLLDVHQFGRPVRQLAASHSFGEIALLDEVPRTATVTATEDSRLLVLDADAFLAAVTGHDSTVVFARRSVDELRAGDADRDSGGPGT